MGLISIIAQMGKNEREHGGVWMVGNGEIFGSWVSLVKCGGNMEGVGKCVGVWEEVRESVGRCVGGVGKYEEVWGIGSMCVEVCLRCGEMCLWCGERCGKGVGVGA